MWSTRLLSFEIISEFIDRKKVLKGLIHQFYINFLVFMLQEVFLTSLKGKKVDSMDGWVINVFWGPRKSSMALIDSRKSFEKLLP